MNHTIPYKLLDWIPPYSICWSTLSSNPRAIRLLEQNLDKINWTWLSTNPAAIHLLEKNIDKIDWQRLSTNPAAIHLLKKNIDKIDWRELSENTNPDVFILLQQHIFHKWLYFDWHTLCKNPNTMFMIETEWRHTKFINWVYHWCCCNTRKNHCFIHWRSLCANTNPKVIRILEEYPENIVWSILSRNPAAIHLLEENPEKINWSELSANPDPYAIRLLENAIQINPYNNINWYLLSKNPGAIRLLEKYPERISWEHINENTNPEAIRLIETHWKKHAHVCWVMLSENPIIFTYDYEEMTQTKLRLHEELIRNRFHPNNIAKFEDWGFST